MDCFFCSEYERIREYDRKREQRSDILRHHYGADLVQIAWNTMAGPAHYGSMTHRPIPWGFSLNYCPECGRKLTKMEDKEL